MVGYCSRGLGALPHRIFGRVSLRLHELVEVTIVRILLLGLVCYNLKWGFCDVTLGESVPERVLRRFPPCLLHCSFRLLVIREHTGRLY